MTLKVTVEGLYETNVGSNQKKYTEFHFDILVDRVKQSGIETHILRRFIPMEIKKRKKMPVCDKVKNFLITDIQKIDDKIAIDGKNIAEMNETEIQQLAALFDIYSIPLPNIMSITALRERACQEYLKNVAGLDIDKDEIKKTLNCYTVTPAGTYKFELGEEQICVDTALLKDANIKEVKTTKLNISEFLNSVKNKILDNKVEKLNEDQSGNGEDETDDKLKGLSNILIDN